MTEKLNPGGLPITRKKYKPAYKAEYVRQVAAGARQTDVTRAQGFSPAFCRRGLHTLQPKAFTLRPTNLHHGPRCAANPDGCSGSIQNGSSLPLNSLGSREGGGRVSL